MSTMEWRSEAAQDRSRVLRCFAGADRASSATLTAQFENDTWQKASSWDGYCETLARKAIEAIWEEESGGVQKATIAVDIIDKI